MTPVTRGEVEAAVRRYFATDDDDEATESWSALIALLTRLFAERDEAVAALGVASDLLREGRSLPSCSCGHDSGWRCTNCDWWLRRADRFLRHETVLEELACEAHAPRVIDMCAKCLPERTIGKVTP